MNPVSRRRSDEKNALSYIAITNLDLILVGAAKGRNADAADGARGWKADSKARGAGGIELLAPVDFAAVRNSRH